MVTNVFQSGPGLRIHLLNAWPLIEHMQFFFLVTFCFLNFSSTGRLLIFVWSGFFDVMTLLIFAWEFFHDMFFDRDGLLEKREPED